MELKTANNLDEPGGTRTQAYRDLDSGLVRPGAEKPAEPPHLSHNSEVITLCCFKPLSLW